MSLNGLLLVDKPAGWTSHDVVAKLRGLLKTKKAGHAGTLDPQATGLVVVALGNATRWLDWLPSDKAYRAGLQLGLETNTQDAWGETLVEKDPSGISAGVLKAAVLDLHRVKLQVPPMVSALKRDGKKLYELAREGKTVERRPRRVRVWAVKVMNLKPPRVDFELRCSAGTYVRTLCHDLGQALGVGACMTSLCRIASGSFRLEDALRLEDIEALGPEGIEPRLLGADLALSHLPVRDLDKGEAAAVAQGKDLPLDDAREGSRWRLRRLNGSLAALGVAVKRKGSLQLHPDKVFHEA